MSRFRARAKYTGNSAEGEIDIEGSNVVIGVVITVIVVTAAVAVTTKNPPLTLGSAKFTSYLLGAVML